jgi:hypothetical protein
VRGHEYLVLVRGSWDEAMFGLFATPTPACLVSVCGAAWADTMLCHVIRYCVSDPTDGTHSAQHAMGRMQHAKLHPAMQVYIAV